MKKNVASEKKNAKVMQKAMNDPNNRGFHIVVAGGRIFKSKSGQGTNEILEKLDKKYPNESPEIVYLPKADNLILFICR